jgi:hypothetical protein
MWSCYFGVGIEQLQPPCVNYICNQTRNEKTIVKHVITNYNEDQHKHYMSLAELHFTSEVIIVLLELYKQLYQRQ